VISVQNPIYVGFEVLTAVTRKSSIYWDATPCSPAKVNVQFGDISHFLSEAKIKPNKKTAGWFLAWLNFRPRRNFCEMPAEFYRITWRHNTEYRTLHNFICLTRCVI
jgi:hypothetical protein